MRMVKGRDNVRDWKRVDEAGEDRSLVKKDKMVVGEKEIGTRGERREWVGKGRGKGRKKGKGDQGR